MATKFLINKPFTVLVLKLSKSEVEYHRYEEQPSSHFLKGKKEGKKGARESNKLY